jgi:TonB-dependent starch-binding outer membrane protein SusC
MNNILLQKMRYLLTIPLILLVVINAKSQNNAISGKVTGETGDGLPGVTVLAKGTTVGTTTNAEGVYALSVPASATTLVISFIGYETQEVVLNNRTTVNISLRPDAKTLEEVVVVGYGTQKKSNLTGAVSTINAEALANRPITNSTQALQGTPGVYVNQASGRPGADAAAIRIRGIGTLNDSNPLVLVDGVEFPLGSVNPNDIETITVLKDAASAAIYGSRAANGVVLVTTKKGVKGKSQVSYNFYHGVQSPTFVPDVVSNALDYMEGKNRALTNEGRPLEYTAAFIEEYRNGIANGDPYVYSNTNWFDVMYQDAQIQEHSLRFSGGTEKGLLSLSLGYLDQEGILLNSGAKRYTVNTNLSSEIKKWLKVGGTISGTLWNNQESSYTSNDENGEGGLMGLLYRGLPMQVPVNKDGTYADQWFRVPGHNVFRNTYALAYEGYKRDAAFRGLSNLFAEISLPHNLTYKITGAVNVGYNLRKYANPQIMLKNPKDGVITPMGNIPARMVREFNISDLNLTNFHTLTWNQKFGENEVSALAGFSIETFEDKSFSAAVQGFLDNQLTEINAGSSSPVVNGTSSRSALMSYFGRINYNFKGKYLAEANVRYDGSSRFRVGNQWGLFPSFSAGWNIKEEDFMQDIGFLNNLKLRASWGKLGNQRIALFSYVAPISFYPYSFGTNVVSGAALSAVADPNISWETTIMTNIGLDFGFLNNRLTAELEYFDKKTEDILLQIPVPGQVADLTGPVRNIGSVSNNGIEITVGFRDKVGDFSYNIGANTTYVKNIVEETNVAPIFFEQTITTAGYPFRSFYGLQAEGIFQNQDEINAHAKQGTGATKPGDIKYLDINGDKIIDNGDRVVIGNSVPRYNYSLNLGAAFKGFDFSAIVQGVQDVDTYVNGNLAQPYRNGAGVTQEWLTDSWTPENTNARLPRLTTSTGYPLNFQTSSFWIRDASYLRLKNIQLGYTIPQRWVQMIKVYVNAQNYLTISDFKLGDPERNITRAGLIEYPNNKMITGGLNITF